jgi:hypothetical protein
MHFNEPNQALVDFPAVFLSIRLFDDSGFFGYSTGDQSIDDVIDVLLEFLTAQAGRLLLLLELQKSKIYGVSEPRLVPGLVGRHPQLLIGRRQVSHPSVGNTFQYRLDLWVSCCRT